MTAVWVCIIVTAVYVVGAFIAFLIIPDSLYYVFGNLFPFRLPPLWSILSVIAFVFQTVFATYLLMLDGKYKGNFKRDLILTTVIGLVCLVLCCIPEGYAFLRDIVPNSLENPKCTEYTLTVSGDSPINNDRIIVCKRTRTNLAIGRVYLLAPDGRAQQLCEFEIPGGWSDEADYYVEQYEDKAVVSYRTEDGDFVDVECSYEGLER